MAAKHRRGGPRGDPAAERNRGALLGDEETPRMMPGLRADYGAVRGDRHRPGPALDCPVTAFTGDHAPKARFEDVRAWVNHTRSGFGPRVLPGGHLLLVEGKDEDGPRAAGPDTGGRAGMTMHSPAPSGTGITGTGSYLPERIVSNETATARAGVTAEWIERKTCIRERRCAADHEAASDLATEAALRALADAGARPEELAWIVVATSIPDHPQPATAVFVRRLGARRAAAFDVNAVCADFIATLHAGSRLLTVPETDGGDAWRSSSAARSTSDPGGAPPFRAGCRSPLAWRCGAPECSAPPG
ncbi:hypothetical protein ACFCZT_35555 [Streptomyces sp. NPDC056230]|uniref:hypothetical protein n=1 Tax=Streptomyces sp. NPDC056230 TaxID=3345754 RepID=UPI0035DD0F48